MPTHPKSIYGLNLFTIRGRDFRKRAFLVMGNCCSDEAERPTALGHGVFRYEADHTFVHQEYSSFDTRMRDKKVDFKRALGRGGYDYNFYVDCEGGDVCHVVPKPLERDQSFHMAHVRDEFDHVVVFPMKASENINQNNRVIRVTDPVYAFHDNNI